MLLDEAASAIAATLSCDSNTEKHKVLVDFITRNGEDSASDVQEFMAILFGRPLIKSNHVMRALHRSFGLFPEEFDLIDDGDLISALVSESPEVCPSTMSVPEALDLMRDLGRMDSRIDIRSVFDSMSQITARVFWTRALPAKSIINRARILGAISTCTPYSRERLTMGLLVEPLDIVIEKALRGTLSDEYAIKPGYPFRAPVFSTWKSWHPPFKETYADVVTGPRYYAHCFDGRMVCYNSSGEPARPAHAPILEEDCVAYVDDNGNVIEWIHTIDNPEMWQEHYSKRATAPLLVKDQYHLRALIESLEDGQALRLVDGERFHIHSHNVGGFIIPRRIYEMPLLVTEGRCVDEEYAELRISVLDGFDPVPIGKAKVMPDVLQHPHIYHVLNASVWVPVEMGVVGMFHASGISRGRLENAHLLRLDHDKGMMDTMQLSELRERVGDDGFER